MRVSGAGNGDDLGHLTYCSNIHAGETWPEVLAGLRRHLPEVKAAVAPDQNFGVGLRLSAIAAEALDAPEARAELKALLASGPYYVFTLNGFPYGTFHGATVKEGVYRPDWSEAARLTYTNRLAWLLADLLPEGLAGSVSTVPCSFKPWIDGPDDPRFAAIVDNLIRHAAELVQIERQTGRRIALALEPEPACLLETVEESIAFYQDHLFSAPARRRLAALTGLAETRTEAALRRHLGLCYDVCHAAVEFEDPRASVARLQAAGIEIAKLQLSAAIKIAPLAPESRNDLAPFDEAVYLHQTIARGPEGDLTRFSDLGAALATLDGKAVADLALQEWRIHYHVPIFLERMERFGTTQDFLREILALQREAPFTRQLEVETYTWDVLPEAHRGLPVGSAIARELNWVLDRLTA